MLALLGACSGQSPPTTAVPGTARHADIGHDGSLPECSERVTRARGLLETGKLWSATRALEGCADRPDASNLLAAAHVGLGNVDEASRLLERAPERDAGIEAALAEARRVQQSRKPAVAATLDGELDAIRSSLARGRCAEASQGARQSFERWTPNPEALLLEAAAATCQKDTQRAERLYARAAAEFEASAGGLAWDQPEAGLASHFTASNQLALVLKKGYAILRLGSTPGEPATLTQLEERPERLVWQSQEAEVVKNRDTLLGRSLGTRQMAWKHALVRGEAHVVPAFSTGELLVVHPDREQSRSFWQRLENVTGKVVSQGTFSARPSDILASTASDWFAAIASTSDGQRHQVHLVFASGQSKRIDLETLGDCRPHAVLPPRGLLLVCGAELFSFDIDTMRRRAIARLPDDFAVQGVDPGPGTALALRGATGLALAASSADSSALALAIPQELRGQQFSSVTWAPDGRTLAASVKRPEGRRGVVVWDLESSRVSLELWEAPEAQHSDAALSAAGDDLALGGCTELGRLELDSGRFETIRLPTPACSGITVAPTTGVLRVPVPRGSPAVFWPERGEPRPLTVSANPEDAQAAGPWVAVNTLASASLLLPGADRTLPLPSTRVLALSQDGAYAALRETHPPRSRIRLVRLREEPAGVEEVWQLPESEYRYAAFTPDRRGLVWWASNGVARLDLASLSLTRVEARWPDQGARLLGDSTQLLAGYSLIPLDDLRPAEGAPLLLQFGRGLKPGPAFSVLGASEPVRWIAGAIERGAGIWSARGELVAQIQQAPAGGWFVSAAANADSKRSLVQPLGTNHVPLWCRSGNQLYAWRVCQDRFEEPSLLGRLLSRRSD